MESSCSHSVNTHVGENLCFKDQWLVHGLAVRKGGGGWEKERKGLDIEQRNNGRINLQVDLCVVLRTVSAITTTTPSNAAHCDWQWWLDLFITFSSCSLVEMKVFYANLPLPRLLFSSSSSSPLYANASAGQLVALREVAEPFWFRGWLSL